MFHPRPITDNDKLNERKIKLLSKLMVISYGQRRIAECRAYTDLQSALVSERSPEMIAAAEAERYARICG